MVSTYRDPAIRSDPFPILCAFTKAVVLFSSCLTSSAAGSAIALNMTCDRGEKRSGERAGRAAVSGKDGGELVVVRSEDEAEDDA